MGKRKITFAIYAPFAHAWVPDDHIEMVETEIEDAVNTFGALYEGKNEGQCYREIMMEAKEIIEMMLKPTAYHNESEVCFAKMWGVCMSAGITDGSEDVAHLNREDMRA